MKPAFRIACGLLLAVVAAQTLVAQHDMMMEPPPPSLEAFITEALQKNPALRANALEQEARAQVVRQVTAWPEPRATFHLFPSPILTARGPYRFQVDVAQSIPYSPALRLQGEIAKLHSEHGEHERAIYSLDLQLKVKKAYYALLGMQQKLALIDTFATRLTLFENVAAVRYEVGAGPQQALLKAQLEKHALTLKSQRILEEREDQMREMAYLLNRTNTAGLDSLPPAPPELVWADLTEWETEAIKTRPELTYIRHADEMARRKEDLARTAFWPDLSVHATFIDLAESDIVPAGDGRTGIMIGASLRIPLDPGRIRAGIEENKIRRQQIRFQTEDLTSRIRTDLLSIRNRLLEQQEQLEQIDSGLIPLAESTRDATLSAYTTDRASFLDLLDSERTLFNLRTERVDLEMRYYQTVAQLERALGIGTPEMQHEGGM